MNPIARMMKRYIKTPLKYALPLLCIGVLVLAVSMSGCTSSTSSPTTTPTAVATAKSVAKATATLHPTATPTTTPTAKPTPTPKPSSTPQVTSTPTPTSKPSQTSPTPSSAQYTGPFVGSKNSNVYHIPTCFEAKKIKPQNLVTFPNAKAAQAAGYRPCEVCKPETTV